jgi:DNA-directed RNA polymerase subunit RPC12/RpoP
MKKQIILASLMLFSMGFAVAQSSDTNSVNRTKPAGSENVVSYTCSMHPEINSDKPGKCPVCGMDLVLKSAPQYSCPMHPDIVSSSPGKCPKCGMDLELKTSALYSCPKHPEVTSKEPGKCTICGKRLQKAKAPVPAMHGCCGG